MNYEKGNFFVGIGILTAWITYLTLYIPSVFNK